MLIPHTVNSLLLELPWLPQETSAADMFGCVDYIEFIMERRVNYCVNSSAMDLVIKALISEEVAV